MSSSPTALSLEEQRSRLERRANVIRSRLLRTIDALDNRRHQVQELWHHAKRLAAPAVASILGVAVVAAGTAFAIRTLVERRRERALTYRMSKALAPLRAPVRPPLWQEAFRKLALAVIGVIGSELAKRGMHTLVERPRPIALLPASSGGHPAPIVRAAGAQGP